jgi:hypothetical protein
MILVLFSIETYQYLFDTLMCEIVIILNKTTQV